MNTEYKLFIDDERMPVDDTWVIARSSMAAILIMQQQGWPRYISFDHDLGGSDTSRPVVQWMIEQVLDGLYKSKAPEFYVHSQNPIGRVWLTEMMQDLTRLCKENS